MTGCSTSTSAAAKRSSGRTAKTKRSSACRRKDAARTSRRWPTRPTNPALPRRAESPGRRAALRKTPTSDALRRLSREAPARLPRRRGHRRRRARARPFADLRRTLRESVRNDGEVLRLGRLRRAARPRRILLLIDVSGSMKARTEENMKLAHALSQAAGNVEVFTFGTRLTRVTRALRLKRREQALNAAAAPRQRLGWRHPHRRRAAGVSGRAAVRRLRARRRGRDHFRRLERGDPAALRDAVAKLSRRAWRVSWLTPLATAPGFQPQTEALIAIRRFVDDLVGGGSSAAVVSHLLSLGTGRAA